MASCLFCSAPITRPGARGPIPHYCSASCREKAKWRRQKAANPCPSCGGPMSRPSSSSSASPTCRRCKQAPCGTPAGYKRGCRCDPCRQAKNEWMRIYSKRRRDSGRPLERRRASRVCDHCGSLFGARLDALAVGRGRFCSDDCARRFQGWDGEARDRWRPSQALRNLVLERDGLVCQLCFSPVRPEVDPNHPRYPHLDHIVPRSRGGSDDESNLRCACRQCNVRRGSDTAWEPERAEVAS